MPYDKIDQLYDALKKDGAVSKSRENFRSKMLAPGKEGYQNRLQLYNALKADGAIDSPTYEEFCKRLGLHAVNNTSTPTKPLPQKPTAASAQAATPAPSTAPTTSQQKDKPLTPAQRQAMIDQVQQMQQQTQAMIADNNERMKNMKQYGFGLGFGQTKKGGIKYNPRTKKFEQTYITPTGNRYSSKALADMESTRFRQETSKPLGLNMNDQQVDAAQKPASAAVAALWKEAEANYAADRNKNAEEVYSGNPWLHGGREMHIVDAATNSHKNEVSRLTRFDLQKMMDNVWGRVGRQMTTSCYQQLKKQYPTATEQQLQKSASAMARQLSDNAVYKYAVAKNTPKSTLEFFAKTAADMNLLRTITKGLARSEAGTTGDMAAYEQAMSDYGKNHRWAQIGGTVTGMMFDPTTYISGGVGSFAGKTALNIGGRIVAKKAATNVGARLFGNTLTGRVVAGVAGGAGNLGTYEGIKEGESQWLHGGHINPATGENEGYSAGDVVKSTLHGTLLGSVTGTVSPLLGNVADKWVKATSNTAGKVGIRAGELATSTVAEGTIFSIPEWISGDGDAMDVWTDNMAMMIGFKGQHMIKSAPRVIAGLRPIADPKTMQERNHNRMNFVERLRKQVDASPRDMAFTKEEREELQKYGYGDLAALFTRTPKQQPKAKARPKSTDGKVMYLDIPEADVEDLGRQWLKNHPEFDGYEAMERLMQDPNVSQSARAKAYYILTGRQLPMGTVTGYTTEKDEHGNIFVKSVTANGEVVTNRRFADEASAKREQDKIMRQAELNSVDVGERYTEAKADNKVWDAAVEAVAPGADPETVKRNYQAAKEGDKDAIANYGQMVDAIDKFMEENRGMADAERPEAIRAAIKEETGVDVDAAIKKESSKRTEPEQAAVEDYLKRLFPEQNQETEQPMSDDEAGAAAIYDQSRLLWDKMEQGDADAKADIDAISIRMKEALQECEDAFGTDAEMRMAEMQDNPWALANDPELTDDQRDAVLYYINAKAAMDGVQDASNDAMEDKRREVAANVERHTHKDNGMVQPATMKVDDKPVYIVKGNVVPLPDGTGIDTQNSDQSIVICDAETGEYKFTSPDQIFNIGDAIDPQAELDEAYANIQAEHDAVLGGMENGESVPKSGESVQETPENVQNEGENVQPPMTDEQLQQYAQGAFNEATQGDGGITLPQEQVEQMQQHNQQMLEQDQQRREEEANRQPTALERVPLNEETGEPMFEKADKETALDALNEVTGGNEANTTAIVNAQVEQAQKTLDALKKKQPTKKAPSLKGSPMAMVKAQQEADANYNAAMEQYNAQMAEAEETLGAWSRIYALMNERKRAIREQREAEQRERDKQMHDAAVAQVEEQKRIAAQKAAEQAEVGTHAVNPKIKAKWNGAAKVEGNPNALTLADGSTIRGHYVLTEAGAASASHDVNNAFEPTEGFPIDENGESVNDRDYKRDTDAQRIVRDIANNYDSRALQSHVIVSKDGVVLSGNNRTMSGDIAAQQGTDKAYIDHLREFGQMYGFTPEQIDGMKHPRVVFVPDEQLPYDATTFARFNAEQQKKQSKPEHAVKLGKIVPDNVFTSITNDISRFDRLSDYYADDKAVSSAISQLLGAGVINEMQLPEMRTGNSLSAAGKELIENTLIGKVFQTSPDAVRHIISTPTLRQSVIMGLNEIAHNRTLAKSGYDLSNELGAAVDLVARAKSAHPDIFKDGMPVSPFGREQGLFDDEYGDSRVTDGTTLLLADILNSGKPSDLRKVLSAYNAQATAPAGGQLDMFTGDVTSKEEILNTINEHFRNATPREQQALVDAAIAERKRIAETEAGQRGGNKATEQTEDAVQRSAEPQQPAVAETEPAKQEETPQTEEPNTDTIAEEEEEALRNRITETDEEWTEPSANGDIYKQKLLIDGKEVIKVDAPDESKNYPGTYYEVDGKQFGDLQEVVRHLDGAEQPLSAKIKTASADVNTEPTEAQKEAGNYKKGHVQVGTFDITIEQPQGSVRKGTDANGKQWESKMHNTYGYFRGTEGVDGDHIDVFLSNDIDGWNGRKVYVVDQYNPDGTFDEHKVMLGFNDMDEAKSDYLANYEKGWEDGRRIVVSTTNLEDFEKWIDSSHRKTKPFAEYAGVKKETVASSPAKEDTAAPTTENADNAAYTITPTTYTNKKGKTSDVSLLTFDGALTADQERAVSEFAKERLGEGRFSPARGWKDRKSGGWMFRSEEDAKKAADMVGNADAVADAQPLTAQELRDAVEPKKPATRKKATAKKPANKVEMADVAEKKPTEPIKEEPKQPTKETEKPKYEVSDEEMNGLMNDIRDILGIGADEGDAGLKFRDPDELTAEQRQKLMSVGQRLAMAMVERGNESFGDYASMMVKALGDKVRPWLKAFYGGLEYVPGYDKYALTPYEEVKAFDVENFDKPHNDVLAQADMIVEEVKAQTAADKANNELKAIRNEQRKENDKQTEADTAAVAEKAEATASEAETLAETSSDRHELSAAEERVDDSLEEVNEQLALLGYYEADHVEKDFNEAYGYMRNAEKKAVNDAAKLAGQLVDDLGLDLYEATHSDKTDKKGNRKARPLAVANIAPAGGDVTMHLPLAEGRELYVNIQLEPSFTKGETNRRGDNLEVIGIMCRVENPNASGNARYGQDMWFAEDVTYDDLLKNVQRVTYKYIPERSNAKDGEYKVGDKVQYSPDGNTWHDAVVAQPNELGGIRIDTGHAPAMWVNAHPDQLRHKAKEVVKPQTEDIANNPQSWVGRTFNHNGTQLVCKEVDGNYATFDNKATFMTVGFEVPTVQGYLKSGKFQVEGDKPTEPQNEDIFQKAERIAKEAREKNAANAHLLAVQKAFPGGKFTDITIGKQKFTSVEGMTDFIKEHNKKILDAVKAMKENPGNSAQTNTLTLSLGGYDFVVKTDMSRETQNIGGSLFAEIHRKMTYSCPELGLTDIPVKQSLLRNAVEDITENVITGKDFAERFDIAARMAKRGKSELEQMKQREGKPFEFGKELEEAERQLEEYTEAMKQELAEKEKKYAEMDASVEAATDVVADDEDESAEDKTKFRLLEDDDPKAQELEALPDSELVPVYRNVQAFEDDALGSPMAFTDAETGERRTLQGQKWNYSNPPQIKLTPEQQRQLDELNKNGYIVVDGKKTTELQINDGLKFVKPKTKDAQLQYFLKKNPEDKGLWAAYDPYDHAIETPLNTQFGEAYKRPNLVVVRSLIPKSEIDEPFHADYALLPTGAHQWNNGRTLYLSRWSKIDKVLSREEEAKLIDEYWKKHPGKREALKSHRDYNRFVPQVRRELEKMGYRFELDGKELTPEESLALDQQNMENRDVIPGREGHAPFMTNEDIARINAKMSGKWVGEPKEAMNNAMAERVNELAERLHTPVRIIRTDEEVAALPSTRQRRMKGSFNPMTGEVTIVVPNNANMTDVENTFIHEVVGHDGLRVLFPEEEKLNNALDELYSVSKDEIRNTIDRTAQKMYDAEVDRLREKKRKEHEAKGEDSNASYYADMAEAHAEASKKREQFKRDATEEYGADLAGRIGEKGFEKMSTEELTFWGKLKSMLQKALQKLLEGLKIPGKKKWGDKEWAFVLHEAYKRKKNGGKPDVFDAADTEVMRRKTGFGETKFSDGKHKGNEPKPIGRSTFGSVYNQFKGKVLQAVKFLVNHESGDLLGVFHRKDIGDIDMVWGDDGGGLCHILNKHINDKDFPTVKDLVSRIEDIVNNGKVDFSNGDKMVLKKDGYVVTIRRNVREKGIKIADKNWVLTAYNKDAPANTKAPADGTHGSTAVAPGTSSAAKVATLSEINEFSDDNVSDNDMKFRDGDMGLDETITQMKIAASQANADNWQAKQEAMKAIGGNLNKLRQAMARQREYDLSTVKSISDLAKVLLDNGLLDDLSKYETKRILSAVNNAHGKQDTSNQVAKVMDIMVDNQLRMGANMLGRLLSTRGSRVDARGIEVQGQLDPDGQTIAQVVRKATSLPKSDIEERIAEALNRMGSDDQAVADEAALEYSGLLLAHQFAEDITDSKAEEKALRDSIKQAKEDLDAGMMEKDAYNEYVAATNDAIRQNKIERAEAYRSIVEQVGSVLGGSVERAKQWREAEKQRVEAIHHNANSDMVGRPTDEHHKEGKVQKIANNSAVRFLLAPLGTFDQMLRMFGKKSVNGEGYLWNRYMRGWVDATEREYKGYQNALKTLDEKVSEVFGKNMKWGDLFAMERKMPKATVTFWDGGEQKAHELTQGNLLYIYMVDKMSDGRMKLRRMGITEEDVENIKNFVDPRFLQLADWMQEEFLVDKRNEYNEVHKRMFGASMAAIENYFPLKILANARIEDVDVADDTTDTALPATSTGSIIKRRRNNLALDVMGADAFSVILDHVQQMERWAAFAEFNRDLNTLLSYKHFRNQVMNMSSVYGGGKTLWNNFRNVCSMAAGAYRPPIAQLDKAAVNIAKGVTAAKVSFRVFTALKQFLSMPAYLSDSNPVYLAANIANPIGAWKWSMENLPLFEKRWKSRMAGDPRLMKSEMDWKMWRSHVVEIASRIGMSPNAFVDALTVAIGSHAMYQTKKQKYLRYGYDEEVAEKRAKQDATILFNQTQQSSESAFLSTMQVDRSWLSVLFTIFRNSSMSYTRQLYDAIRNIKHRFEPGYQSMSEEYMAKQMRRDGIAPDKADSNAKSEYRRSLLHDIARIGVFGYILQFAWNFGAYLPYLIAGDDKDEKSKMWDDVINHTMFGSIEGLTGGDVMSSAGQMALNGEAANWSYLVKDMPLASDLAAILQKMPKDKVAAMNDVVNLLVQSGVGVNPQSLTDAVVAIMDYCGDDAETSRECALLIARIINCPQSQTDKIYFDELGATAAEASKMTPAEIAERYAEYKIHRGAPLTGWAYSEEARDSVKTAQQNRVLTKAKEKMSNRMETEATKQLLSTYDEVSKQQTELSKLKKTDRTAYREGMKQLRQKYNMREHGRMKRYKHDIKQLTEKYLRCKSAEERDSLVRVMTTTRDKLLDDIGRMNQQ